MGQTQRSEILGAFGVAVVASTMLLWALFGRPPYAFFGVLKWLVAGACLYISVVCFRVSRYTAPIILILLGVGAIHVFGKMRKEEWGLFNWSAIVGFGLAAGTLLFIGSRPAKGDDARAV